jgi:branched-chain amino acid transport system permease protein
MKELLSVLPGGMVAGAVYALLAMGLVFIYKATRVPNFAYGAMATFVAFFHYNLVAGRHLDLGVDALFVHVHFQGTVQLSFWAAVPVSLALAAGMGWLLERTVIRAFARAPMITKIIVTLALALLLQALAQQLFGAKDLTVPNQHAIFSRAPALALFGVNISWERLGVIGLTLGLAAAAFVFFRYTATGLAVRASATNQDVASLLGVSSRRLAVVSWVGGSMVAGIAGIALASVVVSSNPNLLLLLSIKGFAAAIVGGMVSMPIAVAAGFAIGIGEELTRHYLVQADPKLFTGAPEVVTLGAVILVLALRPRWIFRGIREDEDAGVVAGAGGTDLWLARALDPVEAMRLLRAAVPTSGRLGRFAGSAWRAVPFAIAAVALTFPFLPFPSFYTLPVNLTLVYVLVLLSFVVVVGWLGQISVAQGAFVAVGGAGAAICANTLGLPFPLPILGGVLLSIPVSIAVGLPALRLRGLHLAIATLAFGLAAERAIVPRFDYRNPLRLPGYLQSDRVHYYLFLALTVAAVVTCWRISRTRVGRSFYAIRDSETVAAAYGIRPVRVKLTGFVVSGAIAALAGTMLSYQLGGVNTNYAGVLFSISQLANAVVGGITHLAGAFIGALLFGLLPELTKSAVKASSISFVPQIVAAALTILIVAINPEGLASMGRFLRRRVSAYEPEPPRSLRIGEAYGPADPQRTEELDELEPVT